MKAKSLRFRIITAILVTCLVITILFGAILYPLERRRIQERMTHVRVLMGAIFQQRKEQIANEFFSGQREAVHQSLEEMTRVQGVTAIALYRLDGALAYTTTAMAFAVIPDSERNLLDRGPAFTRERDLGRPLAVFSSLIEVFGERVGYIRMYYDLGEIEAQSRLILITLSGLLISVLCVVGFLLHRLLSRLVIRPVQTLGMALRRIQEGRYDERVQLDSADEIGDMGRAFNEMSAQLAESESALTEAVGVQRNYAARLEDTNRALELLNRDLEARVAERTRELVVSNTRLQGEIEERTRAENNLAMEKRRLTVTLGSIGDGVVATDMDGRVLMINRAAEVLLGWPTTQALGRLLSRVFPIGPVEPGDAPAVDLIGAVRGGRAFSTLSPASFKDPSGGLHLVAFTLAPIHDQEQGAIGAVLVVRDVTEQNRFEQESQKAAKLESLGVLAGGIAHDFNNILTAILGNLSLARLYSHDVKTKEKIAEAERATLHAKGLTRQLLTFSRGGAPIKTTAAIGEMLKETASFALAGSNAQAVYRVDPDLWPLDVDTAQISQVIHNLVLNAAQAMPEGGTIEIGAANRIVTGDENSAPAPPGRWVALDVRDEGEGVPEALQANIFDPYFTTKDRGTGLGLSTSYAIVKNHGGRIELESQAGRGACFRVWLPAAQGAEKASAVTADHLVHGHGRILVMDDEEAILEVTREALDILGYQADVAKEGAEAIERYVAAMESGQRYDVVIMDLTIPGGLGGREVIRALLDIDPQIRAIVSSGYFQDPIMADYAAFGFKGVLPKPFRLEELGRALNRVLTSPDSPAA